MAHRDSRLLHRIGAAGARLGSGDTERPRRRRAIQLGLALVVFGFLVFAVVSQWDELRERDVRFEPGWLALAVPLLLADLALLALGWDLILRLLGYRLSLGRAQRAWGQSLLARYVPGTVLLVVGRVLLAEREGVPRRTTLASMVYEGILATCSAVVVGAYFLIDHPNLRDEPARWAVLAVVPLALTLLHPRVFRPLADAALRAFGREPLAAVLPMRGVVAMLAYYLAVWPVLGAGIFLVARSVYGVEVDELPSVAGAQALGYLASAVTFVFPGGLGIRDSAFAWALDSVLDTAFAVAAAIAVAVRLVLTLVEVVYAGLVTVAGRSGSSDRSGSSERSERRNGATTSPR